MADTYDSLVKNVRLRWIDTEDALATQRAIIEITPEAAYLELPRGLRGEKGEKGDPASPIEWRYMITDPSQLPTDLTQYDQGAAFPDTVSKSLFVWDGADFFEIPSFIGLRGERGATPEIQIGSVTMGGTALVSVNQASSTEDRVVLDMQLPQGPRGPQGEVGPPGDSSELVNAPDYDNTQPPRVGDAVTWNGTHWAPRTVMSPVGPWVMGPQNFTPHNVGVIESGGVSERLLGTLTIPPLPFEYHPVCLGGHLRFDFPMGVKFDVDVRLGDASTGPRIGAGWGQVYQDIENDVTIVVPWVNGAVTPELPSMTVPANTTVQIHVVARKSKGGIGGWEFTTEDASISFMAMPVVTL
ncbi:phage tail protein [Corynebacterium sp. A21]|uniref:phage tail protein n=1 Tax=Corynebacterium sp. A21 TaxID=3457318 RepID=UPI003FCFDF77